jgi:hypothetical protein
VITASTLRRKSINAIARNTAPKNDKISASGRPVLRAIERATGGQLRAAEADLAVLLAESDVDQIGRVLEPGSTAAVLVWENTWAAPFGSAVRRSGGQLVASGRIPTQAILAAVDADRAAKARGV